MKIVLSDIPPYFLAPDAPLLGATEVAVGGRLLWRVWCMHGGHHHYHGPDEGHREALPVADAVQRDDLAMRPLRLGVGLRQGVTPCDSLVFRVRLS